MKSKFILIALFVFIYQKAFTSQQVDAHKVGNLTTEQLCTFKNSMQSNNLQIKNFINLKHKVDREICLNSPVLMDNYFIKRININFQKKISAFNALQIAAVEYKLFGRNVNKLKLWNDSIIIDSDPFQKKRDCDACAFLLSSGSHLLQSGDPHFEIIKDIHQEKIRNFKSNLNLTSNV